MTGRWIFRRRMTIAATSTSSNGTRYKLYKLSHAEKLGAGQLTIHRITGLFSVSSGPILSRSINAATMPRINAIRQLRFIARAIQRQRISGAGLQYPTSVRTNPYETSWTSGHIFPHLRVSLVGMRLQKAAPSITCRYLPAIALRSVLYSLTPATRADIPIRRRPLPARRSRHAVRLACMEIPL